MPPAASLAELPITFDEVREKNLEQLKLLNSVVFPLKFPDQMYRDCMKFSNLTQMAYHNDVLVGAVAARCEKQAGGGARLYIATLGVLAPYRGYGIVVTGWQRRAGRGRQTAGAAEDPEVETAAVHVQEDNEDALRFYRAAGFQVAETVKNYYPRLDPPDALLLTRKLHE
ncbi:N-acetyltransferase domain-containing protein [Haematococcus lacustris]|uniref:N-acetyltransferase domain-containing protein n=1 Tax=Haematococcus lacustris TaxID=44745 RepID=A0A699ZQM4_HAELA|nr:N-acetyltransferase domain-containing protein [Haematococcus lacustris]